MVQRLYSDGTFHDNIAAAFDGDIKIKFHLAPPIFAAQARPDAEVDVRAVDDATLKILAPLKVFRGTPIDLFSLSSERRMERQLFAAYEATLDEIVAKLTVRKLPIAPSPSRHCRKKSAASDTSSSARLNRPRPRKRNCWPASARMRASSR